MPPRPDETRQLQTIISALGADQGFVPGLTDLIAVQLEIRLTSAEASSVERVEQRFRDAEAQFEERLQEAGRLADERLSQLALRMGEASAASDARMTIIAQAAQERLQQQIEQLSAWFITADQAA